MKKLVAIINTFTIAKWQLFSEVHACQLNCPDFQLSLCKQWRRKRSGRSGHGRYTFLA